MIKRITLHISNDCNLRCKYCFGGGGSYNQERNLMTEQTAIEFVDFCVEQFERVEKIVFFGGEPMLNLKGMEIVCNRFKYYKEEGKEKHKLLRSTIKQMEETMQPFEYFVRCHRAYIVNINHIIHISGNAQGYRLNLTETTEEIPVSRTYLKNLKKLTILHSNDMHGDFLAEQIDERLVGGVSLLSGYVNKVRRRGYPRPA